MERTLLFPGTLETLPDGLVSWMVRAVVTLLPQKTLGVMKVVFGGSKWRQIKHLLECHGYLSTSGAWVRGSYIQSIGKSTLFQIDWYSQRQLGRIFSLTYANIMCHHFSCLTSNAQRPGRQFWSAGDTGLSVVVRLLGVGIEGVLGVMLIQWLWSQIFHFVCEVWACFEPLWISLI